MGRFVFIGALLFFIVAGTLNTVDVITEASAEKEEPCPDDRVCYTPKLYFTFYADDKEVGRLSWATGKFVFIGDVEESAAAFLTHFNSMCKEWGKK